MTALKITSLGELLDKQIKPRELMISPWFKERQACMLYAETGIGKSMFSTQSAR